MRFFTHDQEGNIINVGECQPENLDTYTKDGLTARAGNPDPWSQYFDTETQEIKDYPEYMAEIRRQFKPGYAWSRNGWVDQRSMVVATAQAKQRISIARDLAESGGFTWGGHSFQSDADSRSRLSLVAQDMAGNGPNFVDWKLADNTYVRLTKADIKDVLRSMSQHVQDVFDRAQLRKAQISAAQTPAELDNIQW